MISKLRLLYFTPNSHPQNFGQLYKQLFHELFIYKNKRIYIIILRPIILIKYKHCQQYQFSNKIFLNEKFGVRCNKFK